MCKNQANEIKRKMRSCKKKSDVEQAKIDRSKTLTSIRVEQTKLIEEERNRKSEMSEVKGKESELQKCFKTNSNKPIA